MLQYAIVLTEKMWSSAKSVKLWVKLNQSNYTVKL